MNNCVAIDGAAGTGKSTVAKLLSKELELVYVDTGAMYRSIGYRLNQLGVNIDDEKDVVSNMFKIKLEIKYIDKVQHIFTDGIDVTDFIRTVEVGTFASKVAVYKEVREKLVEMQKQMAIDQDVIMDGRDIGTKVLPNAKYKFFLYATPEIKADRRYKELSQKGENCDYNTILLEIIERDERDTIRKESPLVKADDAIFIDTSLLTTDEVVEKLLETIR